MTARRIHVHVSDRRNNAVETLQYEAHSHCSGEPAEFSLMVGGCRFPLTREELARIVEMASKVLAITT